MVMIDMDMPKSCWYCPLGSCYEIGWEQEQPYCNLSEKDIDEITCIKGRPDWCKLIDAREIPDIEPGDLLIENHTKDTYLAIGRPRKLNGEWGIRVIAFCDHIYLCEDFTKTDKHIDLE